MLLVLSAVFVVLVRACWARLVVLLEALALHVVDGFLCEITLYAYAVAVVCVVVVECSRQCVAVWSLEVAVAVAIAYNSIVIAALIVFYLCCAVA